MGFLSNQFSIVPQYLHDLISRRQALQAPLSLGNAESLLNAVLLLDIDNNLRSASVVVSANPRAWFPSTTQASFIFTMYQLWISQPLQSFHSRCILHGMDSDHGTSIRVHNVCTAEGQDPWGFVLLTLLLRPCLPLTAYRELTSNWIVVVLQQF